MNAPDSTPYDLVIRDGLIVDGTGSEPWRGDVAISGSTMRIAADGQESAVRSRSVHTAVTT